MIKHGIDLDTEAIRGFCRKWKIREMVVFGSILRDEFRPDSDVDFLVVFEDDEDWELLEILDMQDELGDMIGRKAEIVERKSVEDSPNYIKRKHILSTAEPIYGKVPVPWRRQSRRFYGRRAALGSKRHAQFRDS